MEYKRVFVEKKQEFDEEANNLYEDFKKYLEIKSIEKVRVINVYDIINASSEEYSQIVNEVLSEKTLDHVYEKDLPINSKEKYFRVEIVPGQYNQRDDSANEAIKGLLGKKDIVVKSSKILVFKGITEEELNKIKTYYINPVEMREIKIDAFTYEERKETNEKVETIDNFINMDEDEILEMKENNGIAMDIEDLLFCQKYFQKEEKRDPTITEIKLIDTYWSDHCRHTTFNTEILDVEIEESIYKPIIEKAFKEYIKSRNYVYEDREKPMSLMDLAIINMKEIKKKGLLKDKEESEEINAASIEIDVDIDGKNEKWLLMFKNETHNHPTEIEPFGGAATCLGGCIRDPLSGRSYVYQAMRITGSGDPRQSFEETLEGKLPQRKITQTAMEGYSSYGNQIGVPAGYVREIYDEGYVAKRMEVGALVAAAPKKNVVRESSEPGDLILLVGGRTGKDGLGGAVGSSKEHTEESLETGGAEVQKGNPPLERKILRLFRNEEVSTMIKKCNDFGAGGVSVAIGELADGLFIDLDKVPLKYPGLNGTEIALSESQERMAVVIEKENLDKFIELAEREDLETTLVAEVRDNNRLTMVWRSEAIVDISRDFLDTNGIRKNIKVYVEKQEEDNYFYKEPEHIKSGDIKEKWTDNLAQLNIASQKGLVEKFDHSVGSGTVLMPVGGKYRLTPAEGMVAKIPVLKGDTSTCSIMTYGFDPKISKWSPFHGGMFAVIESLAKVTAIGGDFRKVRLTFQEYFERIGQDKKKWGKPFSALLGAYSAMKNLDVPSIGGKDSMSGTFEDIDVPPTLISFAVTTDKVKNIISPEFKEVNNDVVLIPLDIDDKGIVDFDQLKKNYGKIKELVNEGKIVSASTIKFGGIARIISEMSFGNKIGIKFKSNIDEEELFLPKYGSIIVEIKGETEELLKDIDYKLLGKTIEEKYIEVLEEKIDIEELIEKWEEPLEEVFPINKGEKEEISSIKYTEGSKKKSNIKVAKPKVLIPIFTGTHGEYDMAEKFEKAGGQVKTYVFRTNSEDNIENSYKELAKKIKECQILGLPDGSVLGDEPEGGGKFIAIVLKNLWIKDAVMDLLKNKDGLVLGIGNGFQGLVKSGFLPLNVTYNPLGHHVSTMVKTKVVSNMSPWFNNVKVGDIHTLPLSTKEGRVVGNKGTIENLIEKGQIATQYVDFDPTNSVLAIESITSPDGRILGKMASSDRVGENIYKNIEGNIDQKIFEAGINYFK